MSNKNIFEGNRVAWNQASKYHQKARENSLLKGFEDPNFTTFSSEYDNIVVNKLKHINFDGKIIAQMQCQNGRELLSLMKFGAKAAVGFDISDIAIAEAEQLAEISKLSAKFVRTNILEIDDKYNDYFDFIYISEGSLQWFPDLNKYFDVLSRLLKKDGQIFISEIHPFVYFFNNGFDFQKRNLDKLTSYFKKEPYNYATGLDYIGGAKYESEECFWFMHKMADVITAMIQADIEMQEFNEYNLGNTDNEVVNLLKGFPLSYILIGRKK